MKRRTFLNRMTIWASSFAGVFVGISFLRQFYPPSVVRKQMINIGDVHKFPVDTYTFIEKYDLYVYRDHEGVRAVTAVCTHLGCILDKTTEGFECPCHGSKYSRRGEVLAGPAPTNLKWFTLHSAHDGSLVVDLNNSADADYKYAVT